MNDAQAETLLAELMDFTCRPSRVYEHSWQPGDVAVWDNRCLLHRARPYHYGEERVLMHTRVEGDRATELALNA